MQAYFKVKDVFGLECKEIEMHRHIHAMRIQMGFYGFCFSECV